MERGVKRRHTPTMKTNKKRTKLPVLCAGLIASAATAFAGEQNIPTPPPSGYVDTESSVDIGYEGIVLRRVKLTVDGQITEC